MFVGTAAQVANKQDPSGDSNLIAYCTVVFFFFSFSFVLACGANHNFQCIEYFKKDRAVESGA